MTKKQKDTDIVFILDRSGSMAGTEKDTIGGYNNYIKNFKGKDAKITTVLFDDKYEMITKRQNINEVQKLTKNTYFVRGSTALLNAIGKTIKFIEKEKAEVLEKERLAKLKRAEVLKKQQSKGDNE